MFPILRKNTFTKSLSILIMVITVVVLGVPQGTRLFAEEVFTENSIESVESIEVQNDENLTVSEIASFGITLDTSAVNELSVLTDSVLDTVFSIDEVSKAQVDPYSTAPTDTEADILRNRHFASDDLIEALEVRGCFVNKTVVFSDTTTLTSEGPAIATWQHPAWTAYIPGATWIWNAWKVADPSVDEQVRFRKEFVLPDETILAARLAVAADNGYRILINETPIGADNGEFNYNQNGQDQYIVDPSILAIGQNSLSMQVQNMGISGETNPENNPGGALYKLTVVTGSCPDTDEEIETGAYCGDGIVNQDWEMCDGTSECSTQCQATTQCSDKAFARVVLDTVENTGDGNTSTNIFVGQNAVATPAGAWFYIGNSTSSVIDPDIATYQDVPGLSVERGNGYVRLSQYAYHQDDGHEHVVGHLEFSNTTASSVVSDIGENKMELNDDEKDTVVLGATGVDFEMHTTPLADAFYAYYSLPRLCETDDNSDTDNDDNDTDNDNDNDNDTDNDTDTTGPSNDNDDRNNTSGGRAGNDSNNNSGSEGEVLGASTGDPEGEVLGESLAATGDPMSGTLMLSFMIIGLTFLIQRRYI